MEKAPIADKDLPPSERTANRMHLLAKDAARAGEYVRALQDQRAAGVEDRYGTIHSAVMTAAIVVYARSFLKNHHSAGEADTKADISLLEVHKDPRLMDIHTRVLDARLRMIAHSDWDKRQSRVQMRSFSDDGRSGGVLRQSTSAEGWEGIQERDFLELVNAVWDQARQLAARLDREVRPFY